MTPPKPAPPVWLSIVAGIIIFSIAVIAWSYASRTPQQQAIDDCVERNKGAAGTLAAVKQECQFKCVSHQLSGCS